MAEETDGVLCVMDACRPSRGLLHNQCVRIAMMLELRGAVTDKGLIIPFFKSSSRRILSSLVENKHEKVEITFETPSILI